MEHKIAHTVIVDEAQQSWLLEVEATESIVTLLSFVPPPLQQSVLQYILGGYVLVADDFDALNQLDGVTTKRIVAMSTEEELRSLTDDTPGAVITVSHEDGSIVGYREA